MRDGSFLGVVAETDRAALRVAGRVARAARWRTSPSLPDSDDLRAFLLSAPSQDETVADQPGGDAAGPAASVASARRAGKGERFIPARLPGPRARGR